MKTSISGFNLLIILVMIFNTYEVIAGPYIDLSFGAHLTDWPDQCLCEKRELSNKNPVFVGRIGWQFKQYNFILKSKIRAQVFFEHGSSAATSADNGYDFGMIGVRIE